MKTEKPMSEKVIDVFLESYKKELCTRDIIKILKIRKNPKECNAVYGTMARIVNQKLIEKTRKVGRDQYYTLASKQECLPLKMAEKLPVPPPTPVQVPVPENKDEVKPFIFVVEVLTLNPKRVSTIVEDIKDLLMPSEDVRVVNRRWATNEVSEIRVIRFKK